MKTIPEGWKQSRIADLTNLYSGGTPSSTDVDSWNGSIVWLSPTDLTQLSESELYISDSESKITDKGLKSCSACILPEGTLCMTSRATVGYAAIATVPLATNQGFINIICKNEIDTYFLLYWIKHNTQELLKFSAGTTLP